MPNVSPTEIIILVVVLLLVFGSRRLPEIGRSVGKGMREFKNSVTGKDEEPELEDEAEAARADGARRRGRGRAARRRRHQAERLAVPLMTFFLRTGCCLSRGPPIPDGAVAIEDGRILAVGPCGRARRGQALRRRGHLPGLRQRALPSRVRRLCRLRRRSRRLQRLDRPPCRAQAAHALRRRRRHREAWRGECLASGITTVGDCCFSGATTTRLRRAGLTGDRLPGGVRVRPRRGRRRDSTDARADRRRAWSDLVRLGVSPACSLHGHARGLRACASLGLPVATHLSESVTERVSPRRGGAVGVVPRSFSSRPPGTTGTRRWPTSGRSGQVCRRALRDGRRRGDRAARRRAAPPWRTAPARTRCSAAASRRSAELLDSRGHASASAPTARRPRRRSTCSTRCGRL